jgi:hypothetical protein
MLFKCFPFTEGGRSGKDGDMMGDSPISAVRLQLSVNDMKGCRKITLKGLYGDAMLLKAFISGFRSRVQDLVRRSTDGKLSGRSTPSGAIKRPMQFQ